MQLCKALCVCCHDPSRRARSVRMLSWTS